MKAARRVGRHATGVVGGMLSLAVLAALGAFGGCGAPEEQAFRAPVLSDLSWETLVPVIADFPPTGGRYEGRYERSRFQGFRYPAAAGARVRFELATRNGPGAPVLLLYGPRGVTGAWGEAVAIDDARRGWSAVVEPEALAEGAYLVVVTSRQGDVSGTYVVSATCLSGCETAPVCPLPPDCGRVCYSGFLTDEDGCATCECGDECARDEQCGPEEACVRGQCESRCSCVEPYAPVCGADGATYPNACEARCRGVAVLASGACSDECPALDCDLACPGGYRRGLDGCEICACLDPCDACARRPAPVCTLNGTTFLNGCLARCEGEAVAYAGPCRDECLVTDCALGCPGGYVRDDRGCPICECLTEPCPSTAELVCGADGVTYGNTCEAERAGVDVLFSGVCPPLCTTAADCPDGHRCVSGEFGLPACSSAALDCPAACVLEPRRCTSDADCVLGDSCTSTGECRSPCDCHPVYQPVCGVDGQTWENACRAYCADVAVASWGPCCDPTTVESCALDCPEGYAVDDRGCEVCACAEPQPCLCTATDNPVCGADGRRYENPCEMRCAGVAPADDPSRCRPGPGGG